MVEYLKRAEKTPETEAESARAVVSEMLAAIETGGEDAVRRYAEKLDRWTGEILVSREEMEQRAGEVPESVRRDIDFATNQVRRFALAQRKSTADFSVELLPGLTVGQ